MADERFRFGGAIGFFTTGLEICYTNNMSSRGAVLLPTVIMMGAVLLAIGMAGLTVGVVLNRANGLIRTSARARAAADAGVQDAMRRLVRDSGWTPACASIAQPTYALSLNGSSIAVCASRAGNAVTVQSVGTASGVSRRMDAVLSVDAVSGKVTREYSNEVQF